MIAKVRLRSPSEKADRDPTRRTSEASTESFFRQGNADWFADVHGWIISAEKTRRLGTD
jgi:hypothetical protein